MQIDEYINAEHAALDVLHVAPMLSVSCLSAEVAGQQPKS